MKEKTRIFALILIMSIVATSAVSVSLYILYKAAFDENKARLQETVQSRARIIEAVARYDLQHFHEHDVKGNLSNLAFIETLKQINEAHSRFEGFGDTGEFTLAKREGDQIVFLLSHRHHDLENLKPVLISSEHAEPMRLALSGKSGTIVALDYRGEMVMAAYEPVGIYDLGIVAKIDLSEIRAPFIKAALLSIVVSFVLILSGSFLFIRIGTAIIDKLKKYSSDLETEIVERKRAEYARGLSEGKFRRIFESDMVGILFWDTDGNISDANDAFLQMVGYTREDLLQGEINWKQMTPPEYQDQDEASLQTLAKKGTILPIEKEYIRKNGSRLPVTLGAAVLEGQRDQGVCFVADRTEFKQTNEALQESEERYRLLFENAPLPSQSLNEDGIVQNINQAWLKSLGYKKEEVIGRWFGDFLPDDYKDVFRKRFPEFKKVGKVLGTEFEMVAKDGSVRFVSFDGRIGTKPDGSFHQTYCVFKDVTELRQAEEQFRIFFDSAPIGKSMTAPDGKLLRVNPALSELLGYSPSEMQGISFIEITHPDDLAISQECVRCLLAGEKDTWDMEKRYLVRNGSFVWTRVTTKLVRDSTGTPLYFLTHIQDISERKHAQEEQARLESQLREAQKMESIGRLAGGVAHDFNNMLTAIVGFSDLVQDSLDKRDPLKKDVHQIQKAADSATSLTQQLLAFSRRQIISPRVLNLNKAIAVSKKMIHRLIGEDIDLIFVPDKNLGQVKIDPGQVDQILVNLAVNARDAMPNGGKLTFETQNASMKGITCHVGSKPMNGLFALMAVSDNGTGIDEITLKNIFEPFFTTKEKGKGTGLGLSTIHGIVLQNNGHINVYSEPGKGTTFKIYFPLVEKESEVPDPIMKTSDLRGSETILLVEDMEIVRKLAKRTLTAKGYKIIEAEHGKVALTKFSEFTEKIDLLVTDVIMPQMSGKELYKNLEKLNPNLKVLYMSGFTENAIAHHGVLEEGTNFIQKPFRPADLARKVREVLMQDK